MNILPRIADWIRDARQWAADVIRGRGRGTGLHVRPAGDRDDHVPYATQVIPRAEVAGVPPWALLEPRHERAQPVSRLQDTSWDKAMSRELQFLLDAESVTSYVDRAFAGIATAACAGLGRWA